MIQEATVSPLTAWESFYVILGSSAAVMTGLVFVALTITNEYLEQRSNRSLEAAIAAFSTPTIVEFCAVLLISVILCAPWQTLWAAGLILGLAGLVGMGYALIAVRRLSRQTDYRPVREDWLWYGISPLVTYTALAVAALLLPGSPAPALFAIGAVAVVLLFLGIRNAYDATMFIAVWRVRAQDERTE